MFVLFGRIISQVDNLRNENTMLSTELTDGAQRQETTQSKLTAALEREEKLKNQNILLLEKLKNTDDVFTDFKKKYSDVKKELGLYL
jgi:predicted nuclease with TOPRIM domain